MSGRDGARPLVTGTISIGEVLSLLKHEFPDVTISKIRFLESEGLVSPERTASGYRRFSQKDIDQLRSVLTLQRDQYLPLKVIRDHIDAMDRGLQPPTVGAGRPLAPRHWRARPRSSGCPCPPRCGSLRTR